MQEINVFVQMDFYYLNTNIEEYCSYPVTTGFCERILPFLRTKTNFNNVITNLQDPEAYVQQNIYHNTINNYKPSAMHY